VKRLAVAAGLAVAAALLALLHSRYDSPPPADDVMRIMLAYIHSSS
jgi:hypothetical protein